MATWPDAPSVYEVNTWVWLAELSRRMGHEVTLDTVPDEQWDALAAWGFDAVWLMGVWERSPEGVRIAREHEELQREYRRALPDFTEADVVGSPYCIRRYEADPSFGGRAGLAAARAALRERGIRLLLDFVPNHTARDHPWVDASPNFYIQGGEGFDHGGRVIAFGRDPYFPPWTDVAQVNAFHPGLRLAARDTLLDIASQADGVRCDMAMLMLSGVFERTWRDRAGVPPATEYWREIIPAVKAASPGFLFIAEAYWGLEWELQQQGFDFCYDKLLYDRMVHDNAAAIRMHLWADRGYQDRLIRFLENHDEARAATRFGPERHRAAALAVASLPGAKLWHEGQFEGRRVRLPVQLGRRPDEPPDAALLEFYVQLLRAARECRGEWRFSDEGDSRLLGWRWHDGPRRLYASVNFSGDTVRDLAPWSARLCKALVSAGG